MKLPLYLILLSLIISKTTFAIDLTYAEFIKKIQSQNPSLKIELEKFNAAKANSKGVRIPPPMIEVGQMQESGMKNNEYQISQTIPFPTKVSSEHSIRVSDALSIQKSVEASTVEILGEARFLYFSLWATQEEIKLLDKKKDVISGHIKLAQSIARSDSFAKIHLLKAQSELDLLSNEIESGKQRERELQAKIASILNENPDTFTITTFEPNELKIPSSIKAVEAPQVQSVKYALEGAKAYTSNARSEWLPDFKVSYKQIGSSRNEVMIGISLPFLFFWEPNSKASAASANKRKLEQVLEKEKREVEANLKSYVTRLDSLQKQIEVVKKNLIPRAELQEKLINNIAPRDMASLEEHLQSKLVFPNFKIEELKLRTQYERTLSDLTKYISVKDLYE